MKKKNQTKRQIFSQKMKDYREFLVEDYDFDWVYILKLLIFKLSRTRKHIVGHSIITDAKKVGNQIKQVEDLLDRVVKNKYYEVISKDHKKKYGEINLLCGKDESKNSGTIDFSYPKVKTEKDNDKAIKESEYLFIKAYKMQREDLKKALDLMYENLFGWWD